MRSLLVANWKMNPTSWRAAKKLFDATRKAAEKAPHLSVVVAPPSLYLRELKAAYRGRRVGFAVQHARAESGGAHTGDVSMEQCKDAGAQYVIIGHAERRALGESDEEVGQQVVAALALKLVPIVCVGEKERSANTAEYYDVVRRQLRAAFLGVEPAQITKAIVAYEPVWAIGKTEAMSPHAMHEMAIYIRKTLVDMKGQGAMSIRILYGGSIDETNASLMLEQGDVYGFLVGRVGEDPARIGPLLQALAAA